MQFSTVRVCTLRRISTPSPDAVFTRPVMATGGCRSTERDHATRRAEVPPESWRRRSGVSRSAWRLVPAPHRTFRSAPTHSARPTANRPSSVSRTADAAQKGTLMETSGQQRTMTSSTRTSARRQPVRVLMSDLTGNAYALTSYVERADGSITARTKHDVTDDVVRDLMAAAWARGWNECNGAPEGSAPDNPYRPRQDAPPTTRAKHSDPGATRRRYGPGDLARPHQIEPIVQDPRTR